MAVLKVLGNVDFRCLCRLGNISLSLLVAPSLLLAISHDLCILHLHPHIQFGGDALLALSLLFAMDLFDWDVGNEQLVVERLLVKVFEVGSHAPRILLLVDQVVNVLADRCCGRVRVSDDDMHSKA